MYYMGQLSNEFGAVLEECLRPGQTMTIILYVGEVAPGNPLRPRSDRKLSALDWFVFEAATFVITNPEVPCEMSGLWPRVLDVFSALVANTASTSASRDYPRPCAVT